MTRIIILIIMLMNIVINPVTKEQKLSIEDITPNLLLWGQGGSGKTQVGVWKALLIGSMYKNNRIFLIRRKKVDLRTTLWKRMVELLPEEWIISGNESQMYYKIKNGTEFFGFGLDSIADVNKLASTECGTAIVEEATEIKEENFDEKIQRSVRYPKVPFHQTVLMCNPQSPSHWIYNRFIVNKDKNYNIFFLKHYPVQSFPIHFMIG